MNAFVRQNSEYKRELDILNYAKDDLAFYLSKVENITIEEATEFVYKTVKPTPVSAKMLVRGENGDRSLNVLDLNDWLNDVIENKLLLAPSMTTYLPPFVKKSVLAEYIQHNMKLRKADKKAMFLWRMRGDKQKSNMYKVLQESRKIKNNSLSGTHSSPSTPWYNLSNHSTLTSTCRCATSYANSNNEKFIGGLRHYFVPFIVMAHITVAARHSNIEAIKSACEEFNLYLPTAEDCINIVRFSTQYYWTNATYEAEIYEYLQSLTPYERAAFAYTGDMYHIDKYNGEFTKQFLTDMCRMIEGKCENPKEIISNLDDNFLATSTYLCAPIIKGYSLADAEEEKPEAYNAVALTAINLKETLVKYQSFIEGFLRQDYLPLSIADFPESMRKSVPTSDTDSTIFTIQYWCHKYGDIPYSHETNSIQYVMTFLIAGLTEHTLKMYSRNLGIGDEQLGQLEMKNEYIFPTFGLTSLAKHYFNYMSAQEGNVYDKLVTDIKGVNMRSSNAPPEVNANCKKLIEKIMMMQINGEKIYLKDIIAPIAQQELEIINALLSGDSNVYNTVQIKDHISYTQGTDAPAYKAHLFWNQVFGDKYGQAPLPPYRAIKVGVGLKNKTAVASWLNSLTDGPIKENLKKWVEEEGKKDVTTFRLPKSTIETSGIPEEIRPIINVRKLALEIMKPYYYFLEAAGIYMLNDKYTRLISEEYLFLDGNVYKAA